jgi:hypothetical protein
MKNRNCRQYLFPTPAPPAILDVTQAGHFDVDVKPTGKVIVHSLT